MSDIINIIIIIITGGHGRRRSRRSRRRRIRQVGRPPGHARQATTPGPGHRPAHHGPCRARKRCNFTRRRRGKAPRDVRDHGLGGHGNAMSRWAFLG